MTPLRAALLLFFPLVFAGCAAQRVDRLESRLGLAPPLSNQTLTSHQQQALKGHFQTAAAALGRNDLAGAVAAWRTYLSEAPFESPETRNARGYITLLEREMARRFAQEAVAGERQLAAQKGDRLHVALLPFQLKSEAPGPSKPFNRAILAMVASDLAQVPGLKVLERQRIDALLAELKLSESGLADPAAALRSGRLLGAGSIVVGSVYNGAPPDQVYTGEGKYTIGVNVTDVARGSLLGVHEAYGFQNNFLALEKQIVHGILDVLGVKDRPAAVDRVHTRNWDAYARFTAGLGLLDAGRFEEARKEFEMALRFDPNFALAEEYHLATPARALSLEQMRAEVGGG